MAAEIVNLRTVRKRAAKTASQAEAARHRAQYGRTAAEKARDMLREEQRRALLDGVRLEKDETVRGDDERR